MMTTLGGYELTEGFLEKLMSGELNKSVEPICQILSIKKLTNFTKKPNEVDRYRLKLSDGRTLNSFIILSECMNHLVESNALTEYSIVKVNKYHINSIKYNGKKTSIMVVQKMEVLVPGSEVGNVVGIADVALIDEKLSYIDIQD